jgi:hypothetical protein
VEGGLRSRSFPTYLVDARVVVLVSKSMEVAAREDERAGREGRRVDSSEAAAIAPHSGARSAYKSRQGRQRRKARRQLEGRRRAGARGSARASLERRRKRGVRSGQVDKTVRV